MNLNSDYYSYYHIILWKKGGISRHYIMYLLSFEFLEEDFEYIMFLKFDSSSGFSDTEIKMLIKSLEIIYDEDQNTFVILTQRKKTPIYTESADEFVYSFSCMLKHFKKTVSHYTSNNLLFELLDYIFKGTSDLNRIIIRQIPIQADPVLNINNCDIIIPHRGNNEFLKYVLLSLNRLTNLKVHVGIDQDISEEILKMKDDYRKISFYNFSPNPVGPYVIRNYLIDNSNSNLIFFQDSDDIPCADRFEKIANYMNERGCQLCGSHELRLDYFNKTIRAHRFPVNVMAALENGPGHPLFHPTSAITRKAFYLAEKLSEERTFGNDTKFLLHSFFLLNSIENIDEFLYIRRRHSDSLTTAQETMIGSPIRRKLLYNWNSDFTFVKSGEIKLEDSSLKYVGTQLKFTVTKL